MIQNRFRVPEHIRRDCAEKLRTIEKSRIFTAILGALLDEDWTSPNIEELRILQRGHLVGRVPGEVRFKAFRGAAAGLIRDIHEVAVVAGLDADELGYLLAKVAKIKTVK